MNSKISIKYGNEKSQFGELHLPKTNSIGIICLLHGGFWKMPYGLEQFDEVAKVLLGMDYCVWNIEYRRTGETNYEWTNVFDDVKHAINKLIDIKNAHDNVNLNNIYVIGHSAGGHLAVWLNSQDIKVNVNKFIALSPILDLERAYYENSGDGSVERLLQGKPNEFPERYLYSSPIKLCKRNSSELIIHGKMDDYVPLEWSKLYHELFFTNSHLVELPNCGHMDFIDPKSDAFEVLKSNLI